MSATHPTRILFLAANPDDTGRLALGREYEAIKKLLGSAQGRQAFELEPSFAVRAEDIQQKILEYQPDLVHFSGHGESSGLAFEGTDGQVQWVGAEALARPRRRRAALVVRAPRRRV